MFDVPIIKNPAFYSGLSGLAGTASPEGLRLLPGAIAYYVSANDPMATDDNDGTDPRFPLLTIQAAVDKVADTDTIIVMPGTYTESVVTPQGNEDASNVSLIGIGHRGAQPVWNSGAADEACLTINALGWRVEGFRFNGPVTNASIVMNWMPALGLGTEMADYGKISRNWFYGGLYGVDLVDGVWWVEISDNLFDEIAAGVGAMAIHSSAFLLPTQYLSIKGNVFRNSLGGIALPLSTSEIIGNVFMPVGAVNTMLPVVDLTVDGGGDANVVSGNVFGGDYSIAGGYAANATDLWTGNFAEDVAEAEVGDNGLTIAQPA